MLHIAIDVDQDQAFSTNPQKWSKILVFVKSLKYYKMSCNKILTLMVSGVASKLCQSFWYFMIFFKDASS